MTDTPTLLERTFVALLARGHLLIEGVPGPREDAHPSSRAPSPAPCSPHRLGLSLAWFNRLP